MATKSLVLLFVFFTTFLAFKISDVVGKNKKMSITLYYSSYSRGSIYFIRNELVPALLNKHILNYCEVHMVPFGRNHIDHRTKSIRCLRADIECSTNAMHACIYENYRTKDALMLISCNLIKGIEECQDILKINIKPTLECLNKRSPYEISKKYAAWSAAARLKWVPTITFNREGLHDRSLQVRARKDFKRTFCWHYKKIFKTRPDVCTLF